MLMVNEQRRVNVLWEESILSVKVSWPTHPWFSVPFRKPIQKKSDCMVTTITTVIDAMSFENNRFSTFAAMTSSAVVHSVHFTLLSVWCDTMLPWSGCSFLLFKRNWATGSVGYVDHKLIRDTWTERNKKSWDETKVIRMQRQWKVSLFSLSFFTPPPSLSVFDEIIVLFPMRFFLLLRPHKEERDAISTYCMVVIRSSAWHST